MVGHSCGIEMRQKVVQALAPSMDAASLWLSLTPFRPAHSSRMEPPRPFHVVMMTTAAFCVHCEAPLPETRPVPNQLSHRPLEPNRLVHMMAMETVLETVGM